VPDLLEAKLFSLALVPRVVKVKRTGILRAELLCLRLLRLEFCGLSGFRGNRFLFRLIQLGHRHKDRKLHQPFLGSLVAGSNENFGIEVGIGIIRYLAQLERVLIAMVGDDVNVRSCIRCFGLHADEARSDVTAVEDPVHRVASEDIGDLLFDRQNNERRLQETGADLRRRLCFRHGDSTRRTGLEGMRFC